MRMIRQMFQFYVVDNGFLERNDNTKDLSNHLQHTFSSLTLVQKCCIRYTHRMYNYSSLHHKLLVLRRVHVMVLLSMIILTHRSEVSCTCTVSLADGKLNLPPALISLGI